MSRLLILLAVILRIWPAVAIAFAILAVLVAAIRA